MERIVVKDMMSIVDEIYEKQNYLNTILKLMNNGQVRYYFCKAGNITLNKCQANFVSNVLPKMIENNLPNIDKVMNIYGLTIDTPLSINGRLTGI